MFRQLVGWGGGGGGQLGDSLFNGDIRTVNF